MIKVNGFVAIEIFLIVTLLNLASIAEAQTIQDKIYEVGEQGNSVGSVTPVFSQIIKFNYPKGFVPAFENTKNGLYTQEHVLKGETVEIWTQMFSLFGFKDFSKNPNIPLNGFGARYLAMTQQACPNSYFGGKLTDLKVGAYDAGVWFFSCGSVKNRNGVNSEATMSIVIKGENDFYNIQWAERGEPQETAMKFDEAKWIARFKAIMPIKFCQKVPGEIFPYPSCLDK
jgi:hypothetical protein